MGKYGKRKYKKVVINIEQWMIRQVWKNYKKYCMKKIKKILYEKNLSMKQWKKYCMKKLRKYCMKKYKASMKKLKRYCTKHKFKVLKHYATA